MGLVQTGIASEPGTGAFLAEAASRRDHEGIAQQLVESGAHVLFSGGEKYFVPEGTDGTHGPGARTDGQNLVHRARDLGYTVVRTRSELLTLPAGTTRVLGLFAHDATFNEMPEEDLRERGLSAFDDAAPTVAEMTEAALRVLASPEPGSANTAPRRFLLVVEEEATDNFGNNNNAAGVLEAAARADAAIGVARRHLAANPSTLILTCADSDGGGLRPIGVWPDDQGRLPEALPAQGSNGAPIDGVGGTGTAPFIAAPDRFGNRLAFAIAWASRNDLSGGILARAQGLHAERVRGSFDNTQVAELARLVLFGDQRGPVHAQGQPPADQ